MSEDTAPAEVASRFAVLAEEDEELEFEAPPGLELRKTAVLSARKHSVCSITQKSEKVKMEVTIDSGTKESVWPIFFAQEDSGAEDRGQEKRFVAATGQENGPLRPQRGEFRRRRTRKDALLRSHGCHEAAVRRIVANEERVTLRDRELHLECERRQASKEEEGGSSRSKVQRTVSGAKQASRLRPQSEVKQVRFAIGHWEEGAAELRDGGVGRGQATEEAASCGEAHRRE